MVNTKNSIKGKCNLKQECICIPWNKSLDTPHAEITTASDFSDLQTFILTLSQLDFHDRKKTLYDEALKSKAKLAGCKPGEITFLLTKLRPKKMENHFHD